MRLKVKPRVTKSVDFVIPRGVVNLEWGYHRLESDNPNERAPWRSLYKNNSEAIANRSIDWYEDEENEMAVSVVPSKDKLLVLIGYTYKFYDGVAPAIGLNEEFFKMTTTIAKKLIKRALAAPPEKQVRLTDAEAQQAKRNKRGPCFERVPGKGKLFTFTAPCGDVSVLKEATLLSILDALELAEKELK